MLRRAALLGLLGLGLPSSLRAQTCADRPQGQIFSFSAPPPPSPAVQAALRAGRAHLRRLEAKAGACAASAARLPSGYVVATLRGGRVSLSAPEPIPAATRRCLDGLLRRQQAPPGPAAVEVQRAWVLRPPAPPPPAPEQSPPGQPARRSFDEISAEVSRHLPGLTSCLGELWQERPHAAGTLVLRLVIGEHGGVEEDSVLRGEPSMRTAEACLLRIAARFRFPPRWGQGRTVMTYPLVLAAEAP